MKLKYDYDYEEDDTKHGVKMPTQACMLQASTSAVCRSKVQNPKTTKQRKNLAKVFAASLDMLEDLKMAVEVLGEQADSYRDRGAIRIAAKLEAIVVKISGTLNKTL